MVDSHKIHRKEDPPSVEILSPSNCPTVKYKSRFSTIKLFFPRVGLCHGPFNPPYQ